MRVIIVVIATLLVSLADGTLTVKINGVTHTVSNGGTFKLGGSVDTSADALCALGGSLIKCKDAPGGKLAPLPFKCRAIADILFVIDSSRSIGPENFKKELSFTTNVAASFETGPNGVRFGLIYFNSVARKFFDLNQYTTDNKALYRAILNTPYTEGGTLTNLALDLIRTSNMFSSTAGGRPNAPDVVIILTDGQSNKPALTTVAAAKLKTNGPTVLSVGIGDNATQTELLIMSSRPDYVFRTHDFDDLVDVLSQLVKTTCVAIGGTQVPIAFEPSLPEVKPTLPAVKPTLPAVKPTLPAVKPTLPVKVPTCVAAIDLIYVLDSSGSVGVPNYKKQIDFTIDLSSNLKIGPKNVLVGAIVFSQDAKKYFDLKEHQTFADLHKALIDTPYQGYTTNTDKALDLITNEGMFTAAAGARSYASKIAIVVTDGLSDNPDKTKAAATRLKGQGVTVLAVGIGAAKDSELQAIASGSQNVFKATNFDALKQIETTVTQRACPGSSG